MKFNECLLTSTTTQQMSLCGRAVSIDISKFNFFLLEEKIWINSVKMGILELKSEAAITQWF